MSSRGWRSAPRDPSVVGTAFAKDAGGYVMAAFLIRLRIDLATERSLGALRQPRDDTLSRYSASARRISSGGALPTPRLAIKPTATVNPLTAAAATKSGQIEGA